jgi:hypothetical protein
MSAAAASVDASVLTRTPIRSPAATASDPTLMLVAVRNVPAVMTVFGNPNLTELASGVVR